MKPSNPAKFGVAFACGLAVALAGVTIYVKTTGPRSIEVASTAPAFHATKPPEMLNAPKVEAPAPVSAPIQTPPPKPGPESPAPTVSAAEAPKPIVPQTIVPQIRAVRHPHHVFRATPLVRFRRARSFPESQGTIRVEVSQVRQTSPIATRETLVPVSANGPIRTVDEDQAPPAAEPIPEAAPPVSQPLVAQPHVVTLRTGMPIFIRLGETLSTDHNFSGDTFRGSLDRPIVMDGFIIADKGSKVLGKIAGLDKSGKFQGRANLQLSLTEINTTDGQRVRLQTAFVNRQGPNNNDDFAKIGGGAALGAIIGAMAGGGKGAAIGAGAGGAVGAGAVMLGKGHAAVIPAETQLNFQLAAPTTIREHINE